MQSKTYISAKVFFLLTCALSMKDYYGISQTFLERRMVNGWFQENNKSLESSSNFQYWHTPKFSKWAVSPRRILCLGRRSVSRLHRLAHLFFNTMAKLTADLTMISEQKHASVLWGMLVTSRVRGLMMPNLLPGGCKYSSNKRWISVKITSKLCLINR